MIIHVEGRKNFPKVYHIYSITWTLSHSWEAGITTSIALFFYREEKWDSDLAKIVALVNSKVGAPTKTTWCQILCHIEYREVIQRSVQLWELHCKLPSQGIFYFNVRLRPLKKKQNKNGGLKASANLCWAMAWNVALRFLFLPGVSAKSMHGT